MERRILKTNMASILTNICINLIILLNSALTGSKSELPYGSKTPYDPGNLNNITEPSGCKAVQLNMVVRHGSRYPCTVSTLKIRDLLEKINTVHAKPYKYKNLTLPWDLPKEYDIAGNCEQSDVGNEEMFHLAKRFKKKYPWLFAQKYWNKFYKFITSGTPRTAKSAAAFGYGLFKNNGTVGKDKYQPIGIIFTGPKDKDKVLRYYNTCPRYKKDMDGNGLDEWRKFGVSDTMKEFIMNIEKRLQLKGNIKLSADSVQKLFWLCAFATMNHEKNRDWCSVFTKEDLAILEYLDDIEQYYRHSYGNEISYKTNCPLVADIIDSLKTFVTKNQSYPYGIFRFTHIGTITALQSILGMYNDSSPLKANNFAEKSKRTFRISKNVPMAANMAFVLYKCGGESNYKVQILMNERPAVLPCCNDGNLCSLDTFLSCYEAIGKSCEFDSMCQIPSPMPTSSQDKPLGGVSCRWVSALLVLILLMI